MTLMTAEECNVIKNLQPDFPCDLRLREKAKNRTQSYYATSKLQKYNCSFQGDSLSRVFGFEPVTLCGNTFNWAKESCMPFITFLTRPGGISIFRDYLSNITQFHEIFANILQLEISISKQIIDEDSNLFI